MATHKSAEKRHRQSLRRRERNRLVKSTLRTAIKTLRTAASEGDKTKAKEYFVKAEQLIASAATKSIINKHNARRKISRLAGLVNSIGAK